MANRQGKQTDLLLREEGMGGRKGNLCNGRIPRVWGEQIEQIALQVNQKFLPKMKSARTNNKTRNTMSFPMIKTLIQFTHKSNPERLKNYDENASGYSSIYIISWIMISGGCFGFWYRNNAPGLLACDLSFTEYHYLRKVNLFYNFSLRLCLEKDEQYQHIQTKFY